MSLRTPAVVGCPLALAAQSLIGHEALGEREAVHRALAQRPVTGMAPGRQRKIAQGRMIELFGHAERDQRAGHALRREHRRRKGEQQQLEIDRRQAVGESRDAGNGCEAFFGCDGNEILDLAAAGAGKQIEKILALRIASRPSRKSACRRRAGESATPGRSRPRTCRRSDGGSDQVPMRRDRARERRHAACPSSRRVRGSQDVS